MCAYESGRVHVHCTVTVVLLLILQCVGTFAIFEFTQVPEFTNFTKGGNITLKWKYSTDETVILKRYYFTQPPNPQKIVMTDGVSSPLYTDRASEGGQGNESILVLTNATDSDAGDYRLYIQLGSGPETNTADGISIIDPATLSCLWSWDGEAVSGDALAATAGQTYRLGVTIKPSGLGLEAVLHATWGVNNLENKPCNETCYKDVTFDSAGVTMMTAELQFTGSVMKCSKTFTVTVEDGGCAAKPACIVPAVLCPVAVLAVGGAVVGYLFFRKGKRPKKDADPNAEENQRMRLHTHSDEHKLQ